ncbi:MAG: HDOD domain-containing protein [Betaproteobacteria bacterium]|nr:HDOD domain-containing protein [Betaproteobacteria bacterium]
MAMTQLRAADDLRRHAQRAAAAWHHSVHVAAMSFVIAEKMTRLRPEEALFAGLIHDIGYFYLLSKSGDYPELESVPAALDDVLRDRHPPIGQAVLHAFKLSDATLMAVVEHENGHYNSPPRTISDVVTLANMVTARTNFDLPQHRHRDPRRPQRAGTARGPGPGERRDRVAGGCAAPVAGIGRAADRGRGAGRRACFTGFARKRRAAPSFLDPHGGRAGRSPALGALSRETPGRPKFLCPPAGAGWAQPGHGGARCRRVSWLRYRRTCGSSPSRRPAPALHTKPVRRPRRRVA